MKTAFVLCGGASLGAVQVGMLKAVIENGVRPDLIIGTSVGAINGSWLAGHPNSPVTELEDIWVNLRRAAIFPTEPIRGLVGVMRRRPGVVSSGPLRRLIERHTPFEQLQDAPTALHVVATDVLSGGNVRFSSGPAASSILASASIPGLLAPVEIGGRYYMDGAVVNNTPIADAVDLGADVVWVFPTGYSCALNATPSGALAMALHGFSVLMRQRLQTDLLHSAHHGVTIHVVPTPCPVHTSPIDFSNGRDLIDRSYEAAKIWIQSNPTFESDIRRLQEHERFHASGIETTRRFNDQ